MSVGAGPRATRAGASSEAEAVASQWWGHRFCGAYVEELVVGQWFWIGWHDVERMEGQSPSQGDALASLDHFLAGRRRAGRLIARLAEYASG